MRPRACDALKDHGKQEFCHGLRKERLQENSYRLSVAASLTEVAAAARAPGSVP
jgi:hypothetical protein